MIEKLDWDTRHFGVPMGRFNWPEGNQPHAESVTAATQQAKQLGLKQLMARAHPSEMEKIHALQSAGFHLVDTLITLEVDLRKNPPKERENSRFILPPTLTINKATENDIPRLEALAEDAFADSTIWLDRFHADPKISKEKANALYAQWVRNSVAPKSSSTSMADCTFMAEVSGTLAGFLTCVLDSKADHGKVSLNAVHKFYRSRGIYGAMIFKALTWFLENNRPVISVRTSIFSHAVQKAWIRIGAVPTDVEHTFHWWAA